MDQTNGSFSNLINNTIGSGMVSIDGQATVNTKELKKPDKDESSTNVVLQKIDFYTSELHRLLDLVDKSKKTKQKRGRTKQNQT